MIPQASDGQICIHCEEYMPRFHGAAAFGEYEDALRGLIHLLKYNSVLPAARPLGLYLARALRTLSSENEGPFLLVPVPLHRARRRSRGFNQADLIARAACKVLRDPAFELAPGVLVRTRATESQTGFTREQRRENLRGAFKVSHVEKVAGANIVLVDDVLTTGATANECARVLKRAGAKQVLVATAARAVSLDGVAPATKTCVTQEAEETVSV